MADFRAWPPRSTPNFNPSGPSNPAHREMFPGPSLRVDVGQGDQVALWGGGPSGEKLVVMSLDGAVASITQVSETPSQNIRVFKVTGKMAGVARIEARLPDRSAAPGVAPTSNGPSWANMSVSVVEKSNPNEEVLPDFGPDAACRSDDRYIDNVQSGTYDVVSREFAVLHADGTTVKLDYAKLLQDMRVPGVKVLVYYRNRANNKIYPRTFAKVCVPNLADMVAKTEEARGGAEALQKIGREIVELLPLQGPGGSPTGPSSATRGARRWRATRIQKPNSPRSAVEIKMTLQEYEAALGRVFPSHALNQVSSTIDNIGAQAAQRAVKDPRFMQAWRTGNMTQAGTFFHSHAAAEARAIPGSSLPSGWRLSAERTLKAGKGGGRADLFLEGPQAQLVEIDWKTTGSSALSSKAVQQMEKHAGQVRVMNGGGQLTTQESRSWIDYVRPLAGGQ